MGGKPKAVAVGGSFSVEQPLWIAISAFRVLTLLYAIGRYAQHEQHYTNQLGAWIYMGVLSAWTLGTIKVFWSKQTCTRRWLVVDLALVVVGILLTRVFDGAHWVGDGDVTLPTIRAASSVLGFAAYGGALPAAIAGVVVGVANVIEAGRPGQVGKLDSSNLHNIVLLLLAGVAIGFVIDLARKSEETLARALEIQAATRERERLARDIHDGVLQVLSLVKRRGSELGGEAAEIAALAGEQEVALRRLIASGLGPVEPAPGGGRFAAAAVDPEAPQDLRALLAPLSDTRVSLAQPGTEVLLPTRAAGELAAAVGRGTGRIRRTGRAVVAGRARGGHGGTAGQGPALPDPGRSPAVGSQGQGQRHP